MLPSQPLSLFAALAVIAILLLRSAWRRRPKWPVAAGWAALSLAMVGAANSAGAWGVTVTSLWPIGTALGLLAVAAWRSPRSASVRYRAARSTAPPVEQRDISRRLTTFLILTIGALAASLALALGVRLLFQTAGNSDADANAAMLLLLPVLWAILTFVLLILTSRKQQFGVLAACLACVIPALG